MSEKQNENENINDLLKQLQESQGEGDRLFMFTQPTIDETQVDQSLLKEMIELDNALTVKIHEWESQYNSEVVHNTSMKHQFNSGGINFPISIDETKVDQSLLQEIIDFEKQLNSRTSEWETKYDLSVIQNTALKFEQM